MESISVPCSSDNKDLNAMLGILRKKDRARKGTESATKMSKGLEFLLCDKSLNNLKPLVLGNNEKGGM